jgi:hypothetical protein
VLGFAFKADTGDTRESAAITLVRDFLSERARVTIYDPKVEVSQIWLDLSEALPDMPLEQSTHEPSLIIHDLTSLSQEAGHDCRLGVVGCAKQRSGRRRDGMERVPGHRLARRV